jgi:hypothetical protein
MKSKIIITLLSVIIFSQFVFAKGIGTTMFQILQMPMTAYDAALANTSTSGEMSALSNSALIPFLFRSLTMSHVVYLEDMRYSVGAVNVPLNKNSGINFSFCYFDSGEMDKTLDDNGRYKEDGSFSANDKVFNLSYGTRIGESLSVGLSLKYIQQKIDDVSYSGFLAGLDGLYFISNDVFVTLGIDNFGSDIKGYSVPTKLYCGLTGNFNETMTGIVQFDSYYNEDLSELKLAIEKKVDKIDMRFGYIIPSKEYNGTNSPVLTNLTVGLGINFTSCFIDYAWLPKGDLGNVHMFTLRINF